jgi:arsenate reductase (thioredoxin)
VSTVDEQTSELSAATRHHIEKALDVLVEEFGDHHSRETIEGVMEDSLRRLVGQAEVEDFLPALAHRFTRERLKALSRAHGPEQAEPDVLFVGLGDTGRGQMAAALLTLRSDGRVVAHSAGSKAGAKIDSAVMEVMAELGVDLSEAFAKPLSPEVLSAADVVVTMGRSVGAVEIPEETRHEDWRVGDPTGAPVDEVRRVRDEIDGRVQTLLAELESS